MLSVMLIFVLLITSCSSSIEPAPISDNIYKGGSFYVFDNILYVYSNSNVFKYNIDLNNSDFSTSPTPLCSDVLCHHNNAECPLYLKTPAVRLAVDEHETALNGNAPIIYFSDASYIKRYNAASNSTEIIVDDLYGTITSLWIYGDRLYYTAYMGDTYDLGYISKYGKESNVLERKNSDVVCRIIGFYNDSLIYSDDLMSFYSVDLALNAEKLLLQTNCYATGIIQNGVLYFCNDQIETAYGNTIFQTCSLYKYDLSKGLNAIPDKIQDNILAAPTPMIFKADGDYLLYNQSSPVKVNTITITDESNNPVDYDIFDSGSKKMYYYNMSTSETGILFNDMGGNLSRFYYADNSIIILEYSAFDKIIDNKVYRGFMVYDYQNDIKHELNFPE